MARSIRVLFVTYPRIGLNHGGLQIQIEETAEGLKKRGIEVVFYDPWTNQFGDVDICHVFSVDCSLDAHVGRAVAEGIPVVMSPVLNLRASNLVASYIKANLARYLPAVYSDLRRARSMLRSASCILVLNEDERKLISTLFQVEKKRFLVVPNGVAGRFGEVDPELFVNRFGVRDFVLHVGSFEERKNQARLIQAMRGLPYKLVCIGGATQEQSAYMAQCQGSADGNVVFTGAISHSDPILAAAYTAARVFCLPSLSEVMPLTLYEALSAGCRAVVSDRVPFEVATADAVTTVHPTDISAMSRAIDSAMKKDRPSPAISRWVKDTLTWDSVCEQIVGAYEMVLDANKIVRPR